MKKTAFVIGVSFLIACSNKQQPETLTAPALEEAQQKDSVSKDSTIHLAMNTDPVCGMPVDQEYADTAVYNGKVYAFCSTGCKEEFLMEPETYIKK